ncbi:MAG: hypothetical protein ACYC1C_17525 [Chloroflexota bacterium]
MPRFWLVASLLVLALAISCSPQAGSATRPFSGAGTPTVAPVSVATLAGNSGKAKGSATPGVWDERDASALTNGNLAIAGGLLSGQTEDDLRKQARAYTMAEIAKAPWKYYGQVVKVSGTVSSATDQPRGCQLARLAGVDQIGDVVILGEGSALVRYLNVGSIGEANPGAKVAVYGYPVGLSGVEDQYGTKMTVTTLIGRVIEQ